MSMKRRYGGRDVRVLLKDIPLSNIKLDKNNPRLGRYLDMKIKGFNDEIIKEYIRDQTEFKRFLSKIKKNGGSKDRIIVLEPGSYLRNKSYVVIEGNRRLTAYNTLNSNKDKSRNWSYIECEVLTKNTEKDIVDFIQAVDHMDPKKPWDKYAKARFLYNKYENDHWSIDKLLDHVKDTRKGIALAIDTYKMMNYYAQKANYKDTDNIPEVGSLYSQFEIYNKEKHWKDAKKEGVICDDEMANYILNGLTKSSYDLRKEEYFIRIIKNKKAKNILISKGYDSARDFINNNIDGDTELRKKLKMLGEYLDNLTIIEEEKLAKNRNIKELVNSTSKKLLDLYTRLKNR